MAINCWSINWLHLYEHGVYHIAGLQTAIIRLRLSRDRKDQARRPSKECKPTKAIRIKGEYELTINAVANRQAQQAGEHKI